RDYRRYRLNAPPRGYRWVRADNNEFLLIGITSGLISSIIAGR
ncbi:MAG: RcnB family protein, partial [Agrobacterium vaccinii]